MKKTDNESKKSINEAFLTVGSTLRVMNVIMLVTGCGKDNGKFAVLYLDVTSCHQPAKPLIAELKQLLRAKLGYLPELHLSINGISKVVRGDFQVIKVASIFSLIIEPKGKEAMAEAKEIKAKIEESLRW